MQPEHRIYENEETEAILLVDAFNSLNRKTALHNIRSLCPTLSTMLINDNPHNCVWDILHSCEGITQGDMPMYAIATLPLIKELRSETEATQVWYADDACAIGKIRDLVDAKLDLDMAISPRPLRRG